MTNIDQLLQNALVENNIVITEHAKEALIHYLALLAKWNRVYNLTAITAPRDMVYLHIIDSLMVRPYLKGYQFLDVGSGAGLPGIPLAITSLPHQQWTLLDKTGKKTRFLAQVVADLNLTNVEVIQNRCEDFKPDVCFDTILARAFATLPIFADLGSRLLCETGTLIAMKGRYPQKELQALPERFSAETSPLMIKGITVERHIVQMKIRGKRA